MNGRDGVDAGPGSATAPVARPERWLDDLRVAVVPWVLARILVGGALALSRQVVDELAPATRPIQLGQGLLSWDAAFYADIARGGYDAVPRSGLRFFPLVALVGRVLSWLPAVDADLGVLLVANLSALAFGVLLVRLVRRETGDDDLARRSAWLLALAPHAFVLVMGYAEASLMALSAACFLALRRGRWLPAAAAGLAAGLCRPLGVLLVVPALVEVLPGSRTAPARDRLARVAAIAAPAVGMLSYLLWVRDRTGDLWLALRIQGDPTLRGGITDPVTNVGGALGDLLTGDRVGSGLHFVTALALVGLFVVLLRRAPASYAAWAAVALAVGLSGDNLDSLERYALSVFPFAVAAAGLLQRPAWERVAMVLVAGGLVAMSVLAFTGALVP